MYNEHSKTQGRIALFYEIVLLAAFFLMGYLFDKGIRAYVIIYWLLFISAILIVLVKDRNLIDLGFSTEKLKVNCLIMSGIIVIAFGLTVVFGHHSLPKLAKAASYYLFYVAMVEEVIFRGFLQNYLFGFRINRKAVYLLGGIFFAIMHIPFQMFANDMVSIKYLFIALPQLAFTFVFHLIMSFITYRRGDIMIPIALHFAIDFLQAAF